MKKIYFILLILLFSVICGLPVMLHSNDNFDLYDTKAIKGNIDLIKQDFNKSNSVYLFGEAEYYPGIWVKTDDYDLSNLEKKYLSLPEMHKMSDKVNKDIHTCTLIYRLTNVKKGTYNVYFDDLNVAYNIYVNDYLISKNGDWDEDRNYLWSTSKILFSGDLFYKHDGVEPFVITVEASFEEGTTISNPLVLEATSHKGLGNIEKFNLYNTLLGIMIGILIIYFVLYILVKGKITTVYSIIFLNAMIMRTLLIKETNIYVQSLFDYVSNQNILIISDFFTILASFSLCLISYIDYMGKKPNKKLYASIFVYFLLLYAYRVGIQFSVLKYYTLLNVIYITLVQLPITAFAIASIKSNDKKTQIQIIIMLYIFKIGLYYDFFERSGYAFRLTYFYYFLCVFLVCIISTTKYILRVKALMNEVVNNAKVRDDLTNANAALLLSQIKPHFLYNTLNTISYLCRKDPEQAEYAVLKFATFLRTNMKSLEYKEPIMFSAELIHIKSYLDIEKIRFGDRLNMEYQLQTNDFLIPPLTVQPLVENAVKHGIGKKVEGGTITIKTYSDEEFNYVIVADDGVGIPKEGLTASKESTGIRNIKKRLELMLNASLSIISTIGVGTVAKITIPKNK